MDSEVCYSPGSIAGAVLGTFFVTLLLVAAAYHLWKRWNKRKAIPSDLTIVQDPEKGQKYAFDNPCFLEEDPSRKNKEGIITKINEVDSKTPAKTKKTSWSPFHVFTNTRQQERRKALDDSYLGEPERLVVALRGHDFTGLGFNICGNMRDGIFVKDVLHRGPASESGKIKAGDRLLSVTVSFRDMVFEDALTILSYASPYEVHLELEKGRDQLATSSLKRPPSGQAHHQVGSTDRLCHPFYRSQSIDDLRQIGKAKRSYQGPPLHLKNSHHNLSSSSAKSNKPEDTSATKSPITGSLNEKLLCKSNWESPKAVEIRLTETSPPVVESSPTKVDEVDCRAKLAALEESQNSTGKENKVESIVAKGLKGLKDLKGKIQGDSKKPVADTPATEEMPVTPVVTETPTAGDVPEELIKAANAAKRNRRASRPDLPSAEESSSEDEKVDPKKPKRSTKKKAPPPPMEGEPTEEVSTKANVSEVTVHHNGEEQPPPVVLHSTPKKPPRADDSSRKAASLGDLTKLDDDSNVAMPLERAVSMDLGQTEIPAAKKRKAPVPPSEDLAVIDESSPKEPRLDFGGGLKKSSNWGTLEDALKDDEEPEETETKTVVVVESEPEPGLVLHVEANGSSTSSDTETIQARSPVDETPSLVTEIHVDSYERQHSTADSESSYVTARPSPPEEEEFASADEGGTRKSSIADTPVSESNGKKEVIEITQEELETAFRTQFLPTRAKPSTSESPSSFEQWVYVPERDDQMPSLERASNGGVYATNYNLPHQKTVTQIVLDPEQGSFSVSDSAVSKTVYISNLQLSGGLVTSPASSSDAPESPVPKLEPLP